MRKGEQRISRSRAGLFPVFDFRPGGVLCSSGRWTRRRRQEAVDLVNAGLRAGAAMALTHACSGPWPWSLGSLSWKIFGSERSCHSLIAPVLAFTSHPRAKQIPHTSSEEQQQPAEAE